MGRPSDSRGNQMSWRGFQKAVARLPHVVMKKAGMADEIIDAEFNLIEQQFNQTEAVTRQLLEGMKKFRSAIAQLAGHQQGLTESLIQTLEGTSFGDAFGEAVVPEESLQLLNGYLQGILSLKGSILLKILTLTESEVLYLLAEYSDILAKVRSRITKRNHKLLDYDRHRHSYQKLAQQGNEKSLSDEKKQFKVQDAMSVAEEEFARINDQLKQDIPQLIKLQSLLLDSSFAKLFQLQREFYKVNKQELEAVARLSPSSDFVEYFQSASAAVQQELSELTIIQSLKRTAAASVDDQEKSEERRRLHQPHSVVPTKTILAKKTPSAISQNSGMQLQSVQSAKPVASFATVHPPTPKYVVALYDFAAQAQGDLSFKAHQKIELVQRTVHINDWWTGKLNGVVGTFPGNYVKELQDDK